jgi:hypothetical protein
MLTEIRVPPGFGGSPAGVACATKSIEGPTGAVVGAPVAPKPRSPSLGADLGGVVRRPRRSEALAPAESDVAALHAFLGAPSMLNLPGRVSFS